MRTFGMIGIAVLSALATAAQAQAIDASGRQDAREDRVLDKPEHEFVKAQSAARLAASLYDAEVARAQAAGTPPPSPPKPPSLLTFDVSAGGTWSLETGAPGHPASLAYITPGVTANLDLGSVASWKIAARAGVDGDHYLDNHQDQNEVRFDGRLTATHAVGANGAFILTYRPFASVAGDLGSTNYVTHRLSGTYDVSVTPQLEVVAAGEYQFSSTDSLRRLKFTLDAAYAFPTVKQLHATPSVEQVLQYSNFRGGTNLGRNDLLSQTSVTLEWEPGNKWKLDFTVAYTHRFSDRAGDAFDELDIGPQLKRRF